MLNCSQLKFHPWQFEWLTSWEVVWDQSLMSRWHEWIDQSADAHVFFEPSMVRAWVETYERLKHIEPRFLIARGGDNCVIFQPLVEVKENWKGAWQTSLRPVGYSEYDYHDPIIVGQADPLLIKSYWESLFSEIDSRWNRSLDVVAINGLRSYCISDKFNINRTGVAPFISLQGINSVEGFLSSLSQSLRGDIRRQKRRLESQGDVTLRVFSKDETEEALNILPGILSRHALRWPKSYRAPGFHANIVKNCLRKGILHMSELRVNDNPISWHFGFLYKSRYYWYMPVHNPAFNQYSPGKIHLFMCAGEALKKGVNIFDLLKGEEDYKKQWTTSTEDLFELTWQSTSVISSLRQIWISGIKPDMSRAAAALKMR